MKQIILYLIALFSTPFLLKSQNFGNAESYSRLESPCTSAQLFIPNSFILTTCCNDYLLKETTKAHIDLWLRAGNNGIAIAIEHQGYSKFGEIKASVGYGRLFGQKVGVTIKFHYLGTHADHYEFLHSVTFDVSTFFAATKKLFFGFEIYNPARLKYNFTSTEIIPMKFALWSQFKYSDKLIFSLLIFKQLPGNFNIAASAHYAPLNYFAFHLDLSLNELDIGIFLRCKKVYFKIDASYNYQLGFSPKIGLLYQFKIRGSNKKHFIDNYEHEK